MEFRLLGTLEVLDSSGQPIEVRGGKLRTLLAALTLRAGQPIPADHLADVLWGDQPPNGAANALQAQVSKLRRVLGDAHVETRDGGYVLVVDREHIDAERFVRLAKSGRELLAGGQHAMATQVLREALSLWRGDALADFSFDEFAQADRTRLDEMRLAAFEDRFDADLALGRHDIVVAELEALVTDHPLRERMWAQLMLAQYRCRRQSDALRTFQRAREMLAEDLGLEPGPAFRELESQILAHDELLDAPPAVATVTAESSNIFGDLSTFVGRDGDLAELVELVADRRLVTITGPGGVGKTRLAIETALRARSTWRDGTWLVELGPEAGMRAVSTAFLRTFGPRLGHPGGMGTAEWLIAGMATSELLIVLDNCEHVLADAAAVISSIVRACPGVSVLATSREPLRVAGERVRKLEPLQLDDAIHLFASRAADSTGDFVLDDGTTDAVTTICTQLDRLPLAIELAATRTRAFSARQLAELVHRRFGLVSSEGGGRPQRQQTMQAAVDWSFELLGDDERRLLTRLSVFAGGFTLDAAAAVCADEKMRADAIDVLLARLVDKSLVVTDRRSGPVTRFRMLRPIADYATARLEDANETADVRTRHTTWLIELTDGLTHGLRGRQKFEWAHLANTELPNLARAAEWGLGEGDPVRALQLGVNLGWYAFLSSNVQTDEPVLLQLLERTAHAPAALRSEALMWSGLLSIGHTAERTWAMDAVDVARMAVDPATSAKGPSTTAIDGVAMTIDSIVVARTTADPQLLLEALTIGSLHLAAIGSHPDTVRALNAEARELAAREGDAWHVAMVIALDGLVAYIAGELEWSMTALRTAIDAFRQLGDDGTAALFEISLSEVAELRGDIAGATSAMATALSVGTEAGFGSATILRAVLCWLRGRNGEVDQALTLGREVVALARQPFNPVIRAQALFALGVAETLAGLTEEADLHLADTLLIHQQIGMTRETAMDHRHIGNLRMMVGDVNGAIAHHHRAVTLAVEVGLPWTIMLTARSLARALADSRAEVACRLLGNTESLSAIFDYSPTADERELVDASLAIATSHIGGEAVARALEVGAQVTYTEIESLLTP